jgi:small-conductance mechanosensitive channel
MPSWIWLLLSLLIALQVPVLPDLFATIISGITLAIVVAMVIVLLQRLLEWGIVKHALPLVKGDPQELPTVVKATIALTLWAVGLLLILSNLGVNVLSLVAGLGIGGIAVALAAQNILGDIFSSYSIFFDKPFEPGDFIIVGDHMGTVKKIGMKTTRIQALDGEEVIIPNRELTETRVRNFKRMQERRVVFRFGVTYDTPHATLKMIPDMIRAVITAQKDLRFDRAHFFRFGDSSLDFEVVYYFPSSDYNAYMDHHQSVHLALVERFEKEGISFALPTRTVHVVQ